MSFFFLAGMREIIITMTEVLENLITKDEYRRLVVEHELFEKIENTPGVQEWNEPQEKKRLVIREEL